MHDVSLVKSPHKFDLILETVPPLLPSKLLLLGKSLNCHHFLVSEPFSQVDSGEGPLPNLFLGLEKLMKVALIDAFF